MLNIRHILTTTAISILFGVYSIYNVIEYIKINDKNVMDIVFDQAKNIKLLQEQVFMLQEELKRVKMSRQEIDYELKSSQNSNYNKKFEEVTNNSR
jgi:hypothetical protein